MPSKSHSIRFPEFIIHLDLNWDNFIVQNPAMLGKINIISLEPKMFCELNGIHSYHKDNLYYMNLDSIRRKLVQVAQRNCPKRLLECSVEVFDEICDLMNFIDPFTLTRCFKI